MKMLVSAKMVVEIPDDRIAADGTIIGSEDWTNGPTMPEDHVRSALVFYLNSTGATQVKPKTVNVRARAKGKGQ